MSIAFNRRNIIIGAACVAGLGVAEALRPRHHMSLLAGHKLDDAIPRNLSAWKSHDVTDLVKPREEKSLASRLYAQTVGRVYTDATGFEVMMLAAYGETQSRDLQLHRPEICYPAIGFAITRNEEHMINFKPGVVLPVRRLLAQAPDRREAIVYWSRVGDYMPLGGFEQRVDVLKNGMAGNISDGILMRCSSIGLNVDGSFAKLETFIRALLAETPVALRPVMVGRKLNAQLA